MKNIVVILPTYNEVQNIELTVLHLLRVASILKNYNFKIVVIDDRSPDGTARVVKGLIKNDGRISLISGEKNGLGEAYIRGFKHILSKTDSDIVIMMDSDLSHNPDTIPEMVRAIEEGADFVIGSRYTKDGFIPGNWPLLRIINSRVASEIAYALSDISRAIKDLTSGFRAIRVSELKKIDFENIQTKGYGFMIHLLYLFIDQNASIKEVPIIFRERVFGKSKLKLADILEFIKCAYTLNPNSSIRRFIRFGTVGLVGAFVNLSTLFLLNSLTNLPLLLCSAMAIELSIVSNFVLHSIYTFKPQPNNTDYQNNRIKKFVTFNFTSVGVAIVTLLLFSLLNGVFKLDYLAAQFVAICISFVANYMISKKIVWTEYATS